MISPKPSRSRKMVTNTAAKRGRPAATPRVYHAPMDESGKPTKPPAAPQLTIKAEDEVAKGRFSNLAHVGSTYEAFVLDFAFAQGPTGWLLSRILMSPS